MLIPKKIKIGKSTYYVFTEHKPNSRRLGWCGYDTKIIRINTATSSAEISETFWHEVTHAILKDIEHPQYDDEQFVTAFSHRLSKAINSAKF